MDYIETWKTIERFFVRTATNRYPPIQSCAGGSRLYFTVASIVAFQRSGCGKTVFEMPSEKIIIPRCAFVSQT